MMKLTVTFCKFANVPEDKNEYFAEQIGVFVHCKTQGTI
jgi:hypothetical protein